MFIEQEWTWKRPPCQEGPGFGMIGHGSSSRTHGPPDLTEGASATTRFYKHGPPAERGDVTELTMLVPSTRWCIFEQLKAS